MTGVVDPAAGAPSLVPYLVEHPVPERLPSAVVREPLAEATPDAFLLRTPAGRFLVRAGDPIRVQRASGATDADVRCFLEGPVAAAAALLRGLVPLRAATVVIGGQAVAITGVSAAGKSALAAALALRGHAVLADAVTPIAAGDARTGTPSAQPHAPDLVLWPDMVDECGLDPAAGRRVRPALPKLAFGLGDRHPATHLGAIVFLRRDTRRAAPGTKRVAGTAKITPFVGATWHRGLVGPLGLSALRFPALAGIASATRFIELVRPPGGASPAELAALVEEVVE